MYNEGMTNNNMENTMTYIELLARELLSTYGSNIEDMDLEIMEKYPEDVQDLIWAKMEEIESE
ncbi:MAG: hypothetical protein GY751_19565 [Bacteroidetes bacterium]|nr:hypothetical protein [Bacteroidota bacterium]